MRHNPRQYPSLITFLCLLAAASLFSGHSAIAQKSATEWFYQGNVAYGNNDFPAAETAFREALELEASAGAWFNLGNSLARQNRWPDATVAYMRAHSIDPRVDAIPAALILSADRMGRESVYPTLPEPATLLPQSVWIIIATTAFWIAVGGWSQRFILRRPIPLGRTIAFAASLVLALAIFSLYQFHRYTGQGIILADTAPLRLAPAASSPHTSSASAGDLLQVISANGEFIHVRTMDGAEGFLSVEEIGLLR